MAFIDVLNKIRELKEERDYIDTPVTDLDYIFADHDLNSYVEEITSMVENRCTEAQKEYVLNEINSILNEEVFYSQRKGDGHKALCIIMDQEKVQGKGFLNDPYIGIYDGPTFRTSKNMVRVGLKTGDLINHSNVKDKGFLGHLKGSADQLDDFIDLLNKPCNMGKYKGMLLKDAINAELEDRYKNDIGDGDFEPVNFDGFEIGEDKRTKDKKERK